LNAKSPLFSVVQDDDGVRHDSANWVGKIRVMRLAPVDNSLNIQ